MNFCIGQCYNHGFVVYKIDNYGGIKEIIYDPENWGYNVHKIYYNIQFELEEDAVDLAKRLYERTPLNKVSLDNFDPWNNNLCGVPRKKNYNKGWRVIRRKL